MREVLSQETIEAILNNPAWQEIAAKIAADVSGHTLLFAIVGPIAGLACLTILLKSLPSIITSLNNASLQKQKQDQRHIENMAKITNQTAIQKPRGNKLIR